MAEKILETGSGGDDDEYFATLRRSEYLEPEKILLLALLEDAIDSYRKFAHARTSAARQQFRKAEEWLMGGGDRGVFSCENICAVLGLDPGYLRRGIREAAQRLGPKKRPRRHARHRHAA
jgi:hypothetical protein